MQVFLDPPSPLQSFFFITCRDSLLTLKLLSSSSNLKSSLLYSSSSTSLSCKLASDSLFTYKYIHKSQSLPLSLLLKFNFQENQSKKNQISFEYKHQSFNLNIKIRDRPMNLVFNSTIGNSSYGFHNKLKSNLRLNKLQKCIFGSYYSANSLSSLFKYNLMTSESSLFLQSKISESRELCQVVQYNSRTEALQYQFGLTERFNENLVACAKLNTRGLLYLHLVKSYSQALTVELGSMIDLAKSTGKTLVGGGGVKVSLNFNLSDEQ